MNEVKILDGAMSLDESNDVVGLHHHKYAQNGVFKGNAPMMHFTSIRGNSSVQNSSLTTGTNCALQGVSVFIPDCSIVAHATTSSTTTSSTTTSSTTSSSTTSSTTTLAPIWYTLYNCSSGQTDSTMALPPFTFNVGDILSYNNSLFFRVLQQVDTDPGGSHWNLVKTQLTQCPATSTTTSTLSVLTVSGIDYCDNLLTPNQGKVALTINGGSGVYSIAVGYGSIDPNSFVNISGGNFTVTSSTSPYNNGTGLRNSTGQNDRLIIAVKDTAGGSGSYSSLFYCAATTTTSSTTTSSTTTCTPYGTAIGSAYCVNPNVSPTYRQIRADGNCGTYNDDSTNYAACCIPYGTNVGAPYCVNPNVSSTLRQLKADGQCGTYNYDTTSCETCCPPYGPTGASSYCVGTSLFTPYYSGCCSITDVETPNSPTCAEVYVLHDCISPSSSAYSIVYPIGTFAVGDLVTVSGVYYSVYSTTVPSAAGTLVLTSTGQTGCPQYTQLYNRCNQSYYYINTTGISGDGTSSYSPYDCFTVQSVTSTPTGTQIYDWTSVESCNCSG